MLDPLQLKTPPIIDIIVFPPAKIAPVIAYSSSDNSLLAYTARDGLMGYCDVGGSSGEYNYDMFYEDRCDDCKYNFDEQDLDDEVDDDGNTIRRIAVSACPQNRDGLHAVFGYHNQCEAGYSYNEEQEEYEDDNRETNREAFGMPPLLFSYPITKNRASQTGICNWDESHEHGLQATHPMGCLNVGSGFNNICWGEGDVYTFSAQVTQFISSTFNEDLLTYQEFRSFIRDAETRAFHPVDNAIVLRSSINEGPQPEAVITLGTLIPEFLIHFTATGFSTQTPLNGLVPLLAHRYEDINGFITPPLPVANDRCWFLSVEGHLLAQVPVPQLAHV